MINVSYEERITYPITYNLNKENINENKVYQISSNQIAYVSV